MDVASLSIVVEEKSFGMKEALVPFIQSLFNTQAQIPLHAPFITKEEGEAAQQEIQTGLFSTSGKAVSKFESKLATYLNTPHVLATNSGTSALHTALLGCGVGEGDLVITQAISFVASANTIRYCGAEPVFLDVNESRLSLCITALNNFLSQECDVVNAICIHKTTRKKVKACVVVHTFGHPALINQIAALLNHYHIDLVEDAAQAFGSTYQNQFCGTFGRFGCISFNGNKIITTGGGGALICRNEGDYSLAKQRINQGKQVNGYQYYHSMIGYNYAMPSLNAAIGLIQLKHINDILSTKKTLATAYNQFFEYENLNVVQEPEDCKSNWWLNNLLIDLPSEKDDLIKYLNGKGVEARPLWWCLPELPMYKHCMSDDYNIAKIVVNRVVSLPSGSLYSFLI